MLLSQAVRLFLLTYRMDHAAKTTEGYADFLGRWVRFSGDPDLASLSAPDVAGFYLWLQHEYVPKRTNQDSAPLSPSSVHFAWAALRSFWAWAADDLHVARQDGLIKPPRWKPPEVQPYTREDVKRLLAAVKTNALRDRAIIKFLLDTGVRCGEACRVTWSDVNLETGDVFIRPFSTGQKTKSRHVFLSKDTLKAILRYQVEVDAQPDGLLFGMNINAVRLMLKRLEHSSGVPDVHAHRFRHTFAIEYLRNGGDVFTLQRLLGHSSLEMVRHYLALAQTDAQTAHRRASPVERWKL